MNEVRHEEILSLLGEIWKLSPDVRFGQLVAHLGFLGEAHQGRSLGYIDDDEIVAVLKSHKAELEARQPELARAHNAVA